MRKLVVGAVAGLLFACNEPAPPPPPPPRVDASATHSKEMAITSISPGAVQAFQKGRELYEDARDSEAIDQFMRALSLDPNLALAHAYLALDTTGARAAHHIEEAARLAPSLPEAERLAVMRIVAQQRGDDEQRLELTRKLAAAAPTDWHAQWHLGGLLFDERQWGEAEASLNKAIALNPEAGAAHNMLGYTLLFSGKPAESVESFKKYVALKPNDANPHDSLGEALLAAGRYEEAEASFQQALGIAPHFWDGWEGVAESRFFRGNWTGGRDALAAARQVAARPFDKLETDRILAWSYLSEGKPADALKAADALEKQGEAQETGDWWKASPSLLRAAVLTETGKYADSLKEVQTALARSTSLIGVQLNDLRRQALAWRVWDEARLGKAADAAKTLALIEEEAKKAPSNATLASEVHFARGAVALAKNDTAGAARELNQCIDTDYYCRYQAVLTLEKIKDPTAAAARATLLSEHRRDSMYVYVWAKLSQK